MRVIKPVIQLAKERALVRFSAIASRMLVEAAESVGKLSRTAGSAREEKTISAAKAFLATRDGMFHKNLCARYADYVERAMVTMYSDKRPGLKDNPSENWALIDDDTIVRQIEVDRGVVRLRDADQLSLGRLNLMIAQLHEERDVRERENPFRPYLMSRALHDVMAEMGVTGDVAAMLFDHLSHALAAQLPEYFAALRDVFESNGVRARLLARPASLTRRDREMLIPAASVSPAAYVGGTASGGTSVSGGLPTLQNAAEATPALDHVLSLLGRRASDAAAPVSLRAHGEQVAVDEFVRRVFKHSTVGRSDPAATDSAEVTQETSFRPYPLATKLGMLQHTLAANVSDANADQAAFKLQSGIRIEQLDGMERVLMELVVLVFDYIDGETSIEAPFRFQLARLQVPFLKAALLQPEMLQRQNRPFVKLLNRMASVTLLLEATTSPGSQIAVELTFVVDKILRDFQSDMTIFTGLLAEFDAALKTVLRTIDPDIVPTIAACEAAQKDSQQCQERMTQTVEALRERLSTITVDPRAAHFILNIWSRVLVHVSGLTNADDKAYRDVIADLIWSVQEHDRSERGALLSVLKGLVTSVRNGMKMIDLPEADSARALDDLVAMHAHVLGTIHNVPLQTSVSCETLRNHFAHLRVGASGQGEAARVSPPNVQPARLKETIANAGVLTDVFLDYDEGGLPDSDSDSSWLDGMENGTSVECWIDNRYLPAKVVWIDSQRSIFLLRLHAASDAKLDVNPGGQQDLLAGLNGKASSDQVPHENGLDKTLDQQARRRATAFIDLLPDNRPRLRLYSAVSLIKCLREGSVGMIENAPIFQRAIQSLLDAGSPPASR